MNDIYFDYGDKEKNYLKKQDPVLGRFIDSRGHIYRTVNKDLFESAIQHVIGQQISSAAATSVWKKLVEKVDIINAENIILLGRDEIQSCGITFRKAEYITGFAHVVLSGELDITELESLSDEQVTKKLTSLKGIGEWTAQMLLIFGLHRPDVLSYGDLAIKRGICNLYGYGKIEKKEFDIIKQIYSPYATVASLYLWDLSKL